MTTIYQHLNVTYFTYPFRKFNVPTIAEIFSGSLRFGLTTDIVQWFGTVDEGKSYTNGLICVGTIVGMFFFWWLILLIVLYFCGYDRVGYLCGSPFYIIEQQSTSITNYSSKQQQQQQQKESSLGEKIEFGKLNETRETARTGTINGSIVEDETERINNNSNNNNIMSGSLFDEDTLHEQQTSKTKTNQTASKSISTRIRNYCCCCCCSSSSSKISTETTSIWIRRIFIVSGVLVMIFSILFVTQGVNKLQKSIRQINLAAKTIQYMSSSLLSNSILSIIDDVQDTVSTSIDTLVGQLDINTLCPIPAVENEFFRTDGRQQLLSYQTLQNLSSNLINEFNTVQNYTSIDITDITVALQSGLRSSTTLYNTTAGIRLTDWKTLLVLLLYTLVPCLVISSAIIASNTGTQIPKSYQTTMTWIIFPIFIVLTVLAAVVCSIGLVMTNANADFCSPKVYQKYSNINDNNSSVTINPPDETIIQIIQKLGYDLQSDEFSLAFFYISQCIVQNPFDQIQLYQSDVDTSLRTISALKEHLTKTDVSAELDAVCGRTYTTFLANEIGNARGDLASLSDGLNKYLNPLSCTNIVPIYQTALYDAACDTGMVANAWIFFSTLFISIFGFIMITFRSAYSDTVYRSSTVPKAIVQTKSNKEQTDKHPSLKTVQIRSRHFDDNRTLASQIGAEVQLVKKENSDAGNIGSRGMKVSGHSLQGNTSTVFVSTDSILSDYDDTEDKSKAQKKRNVKSAVSSNNSKKSLTNTIPTIPIYDDNISDDEDDLYNWTPCFPSETKIVGEELDKILNDLWRTRST